MNQRHVIASASLLLLAGCVSPVPFLNPTDHASLSVRPAVRAGGYHSQAVVTPPGLADVYHVQVKLFTLIGDTESPVLDPSNAPVMVDVASTSLEASLVFGKLHLDTTYRVRAFAYRDAATASLISTTDSGSYVDVALTSDDRPSLTTLPVQLIDSLFDGQATASLSLTNGGLVGSGTFGTSTSYTVSTLAGSAGLTGYTDGTGSAARFNTPYGVAAEAGGNLYVADTSNSTIRMLTARGVVTTLAGVAGLRDVTDGATSSARFNYPQGVAVDGSGNVYVADTGNNTIRKITPAGVVSTLAGSAGQTGSTDGATSSARFNAPYGVAVDGGGNVYVADFGNNTLRRITPVGVVSTLAGSAGQSGFADGATSSARFNAPFGVAVDGSGNAYVPDYGNHTLRKITPAGIVSTLAGLAGQSGGADGTGAVARFNAPRGVAAEASGNVYVSDGNNQTLRMITPTGVVTTLAGSVGQTGSSDGTGAVARFNFPVGVAVDAGGNLYVAETHNHTIRKLQ